MLEWNTAAPIHTIHQVAQLTPENLQDAAESLNGTLENGLLTFKISNHTLHAIAGDWLVVFGTDVHVYTDKYFQRNYMSVDKELPIN